MLSSIRRLVMLAVLVFIALLVAHGLANATIWDLSKDFSSSTNPNGAWSFALKDANQNRYVYNYILPLGFGTLWGYGSQTDVWGNVTNNSSTSPVEVTWSGGMYWEAGMATCQSPWDMGNKTVIRWTAPSAMTVKVYVKLTGQMSGASNSTDATVNVIHGSSDTLVNGVLSGFAGRIAKSYADRIGSSPVKILAPTSVTVAANDTIDVTVERHGAQQTNKTGVIFTVGDVAGSGVLQGTVTAQGAPLAAVSVKTADGAYSAVTETDGTYAMIVPAGTYTLNASCDGYVTSSASDVVVGAGASITQNFNLSPTAIRWDLSSDFSTSTNPNGAWSYGSRPSDNSASVTTFNSNLSNVNNFLFLWMQDSDPDSRGSCGKNTTLAAQEMDLNGNMLWEAGAAGVTTPSDNTYKTVVRWTAPRNMTVKVYAKLIGEMSNTDANVAVVMNTTSPLLSSVVSGFAGYVANGFADRTGSTPVQILAPTTLSVSKDDTIDLTVQQRSGLTNETGVVYTIGDVTSTGVVTGTVTQNSQPVGGITVRTSDALYSAVTEPDGTYTMIVPVGSHVLKASSNGSASSSSQSINITAGTSTTQDFVLTSVAFWDAAKDFSSGANPNEAWSYGFQRTDHSVSPMFFNYKLDLGFGTLWGYNGNTDAWGNVTKNTSTHPASLEWLGGIYMEAGMLTCESPYQTANETLVRWTAPRAMTVKVYAKITGQMSGASNNADANVSIVHNGSNALLNGVLAGFAGRISNSFSDRTGATPVKILAPTSVTVAKNDTIDLLVSQHGSQQFNKTGFTYSLGDVTATGVLQGTVTVGSSPLAGVTVQTSDGAYSAVTEIDGTYTMIVPAGTYTLSASRDGYVTSSVSGVAVGAGANITRNFNISLSVPPIRWDLSSDFSTTANPNGVWSFALQDSNNVRYVYNFNMPQTFGTLWGYGGQSDAWGNVDKNTWVNPVEVSWSGGMYFEAGMTTCQSPFDTGNKTVIRWTAPRAMTVGLYAKLTAQNSGASNITDATVSVVHNGSNSLLNSVLSGFAGRISNSYADRTGAAPVQILAPTTLAVVANDTIDLIVTKHGSQQQNKAGVTFTIGDTTATGVLKGTVTANGSPVAAAIVKTSDGVGNAVTELDGTYTMIVPAGTYTIETTTGIGVWTYSGVTVTAGGTKVQNLSYVPPAPSANPPMLTDMWSGKARFKLDVSQLGLNIRLHCTSMTWEGSQLVAYYNRSNNDNMIAIGRGVSTDGLTWANDPAANLGIVLDVGASGQWDSNNVGSPGLYKDGGTYYLAYEGDNTETSGIGFATSADGVHFTKSVSNPILSHSGTGIESDGIGTPTLYKANGLWYLFYHASDGVDCRDCVATGTSLTNLTKYSVNPIINTVPNTWESGTIGRRSHIFKEGSYYYLAYEGSTDQVVGGHLFDNSNWSSGLARSTNLLDWTKYPSNPIIPQTIGTMGNDVPELVQIGGVYYLYVRTTGNTSARYRLEWNPTLGDAKTSPLGTELTFKAVLVAKFGSHYYFEASDRSSAIRVDSTVAGLSAFDINKEYTIIGSTAIDSANQERYLDAVSITPTGTTNVIAPLGLTNKSVGGGNIGNAAGGLGQIGVVDGFGLNNIGLLVRTTGIASNGNTNGFTLDDGSGVAISVAISGAGSTYDGQYVAVTGISGISNSGARLVKVQNSTDIQSVSP